MWNRRSLAQSLGWFALLLSTPGLSQTPRGAVDGRLNPAPSAPATYQEQSSYQKPGTKVEVAETYRADSRVLLEDYLKDHPKTKGGAGTVEIGRSGDFKFIVQADNNVATTLNVNLFVTVEKGYVQLTREQKQSLSMASVQSSLVKKFPLEGKTMVRFEANGIQLGSNTFVRVTQSPTFEFRDDDEYYFIAAKGTVANGEMARVEKVDPVDLLLKPGSDRELAQFGIQPPSRRDYLARMALQDPQYAPWYPVTMRAIESANAKLNSQNEVRWQRFCDELLKKRRELGVSDANQSLKPELFLRYHYATLSGQEERSPRFTIGTDEYLSYEWNIERPTYLPLKSLVNLPFDFYVAFTQLNKQVSEENLANHAANTQSWNRYLGQLQKANLPNPYYSQYYYRYAYDGSRSNTTWIQVTPNASNQDDPPQRGSYAALRAHGIELPKFYSYVLVKGAPFGGPHVDLRWSLHPSDIAAYDRYNSKVKRANYRNWSRFATAIRDAGMKVSDFTGKTILGVYLAHPDDVHIVNLGRYFYFTRAIDLPEIPEED